MPAWSFALLAALGRALAMPGFLGDWAWLLLLPAIALRFHGWKLGHSLRWDYAAGVLYWLISFHFLVHVHPLAPVGAALILGSCWWVEALLYRWLRRGFSHAWASILALPAAEYLRMTWFYLFVGGVPWASLGLPLGSSPFHPWASVLGESGLVLWAVFLTALLFALARRWAWQTAAPAVFLAALAMAASTSPEPADRSLQCLSLQPGVGVEAKNRRMGAREFFALQLELTDRAYRDGVQPDLVLWAETMWPFPGVEPQAVGEMRRPWYGQEDEVKAMEEVQELQQRMARLVLIGADNPAERPPFFLTGAHFYYPVDAKAPPGEYSARATEFVLFDKMGQLVEHFSKQELVPFGETLPLDGALPGSSLFVRWAHRHFGLRPDFIRTEASGPLQAVGRLPRLGGAVCWDNVFESAFRRQADAGAQAFVVLSNEDWFGPDSLEMVQMVAATRLRAIESGLAVLRCTNTGQTCLVRADGTVENGPAPGESTYWVVDLPVRGEGISPTPYRKWGWALLPGWSLATLLALLRGFRGWFSRKSS